jgi:MSHA biogenesis protein MshN
MSVLNQMLRDLEKRGAIPDLVAAAGTATVARPALALAPRPADRRRRWIWATVLAVAAAFVAIHSWLTYRVQSAATSAAPLGVREFGAVAGAPAPAPAVAPPIRVATSAPPPPAPAAPPAAAPVAAKAPPMARPRVAAAPAPATAPPAAPAPDTAAPSVVVRPANELARDVDRAAELIARGRSNEAMELLVQVLQRQPNHAAARASLAALLAEAGRREPALQVLLAGAELDAAQFAAPAARLQAEMGDVAGALQTLARVPAARRTAAHEALAAGLAQRAGDHMTAIAAYRRALGTPQAEPVWWVGLAVSLEATDEPGEARVAYTRAAAEARLPADVRRYVAERLSVLGARRGSMANVF